MLSSQHSHVSFHSVRYEKQNTVIAKVLPSHVRTSFLHARKACKQVYILYEDI